MIFLLELGSARSSRLAATHWPSCHGLLFDHLGQAAGPTRQATGPLRQGAGVGVGMLTGGFKKLTKGTKLSENYMS